MPKQQTGAIPAAPVFPRRAVYTAAQLRAALGLRPNTLRREIAAGRLRVAKRAGRYFFLGAWITQWIRTGERGRTPGRNGTVALDTQEARHG